MSDPMNDNTTQGRQLPGAGSVLAFVLAVLILAGCLVGSRIIEWVQKLPVEWPEGVTINEEFRNVKMPDVMGPYRAVQEGEFGYVKQNQPPGPDNILTDDVMPALGIGHPIDDGRYLDRRSNWYGSRYYIDTRDDASLAVKNWRLDIYYYTGSRDPAPHVGEKCIVAGGGQILGSEAVTFAPLPLRERWNEGVPFHRILAELYGVQGVKYRHVEYYVFAVNDAPMNSRVQVKNFLNRPTVTYSYFAKIQFSPILGKPPGDDLSEIDKAAEEFASHFMGPVLEMLPTQDDIKQIGD